MIFMKKLKLIKFYRNTCTPCKLFNPVIEKFISNHPEVELQEIDCSEEVPDEWAQEIRSVPTLIVVEEDKPNRKLIGLKTYAELEKFIFNE